MHNINYWKSPDGNPLLEAAGISYNHTEVSDTGTSSANAIVSNS